MHAHGTAFYAFLEL
ncbi:hypothetical protein F383_33625 [Gossypium arboreum]|uniref:Uncharacterized protein n=1 Tax=Gossypium arboreum TaxID=29729 RepID=A0A0B0MX48_GOSAR|nr:hypothetical protein F383_33625 [Gossypium arboreum]